MLRFYLGLTIRNLLRHKRRTLLTSSAIAVGILYFIGFDSIMSGADRDAIRNLIDLETGHLQVVSTKHEEKPSPILEDLLADGAGLAARIASVPQVKAVAPRLFFPVSVIGGLDELPATGVGVDTSADPKVFTVKDYVQAGRWLRPGEHGLVVGKRLAELLDISLGDLVTIRMRTRTRTLQALDLEVVGLVASPHPGVNQGQIFLPLDVAQEAAGAGGGVTAIVVRTEEKAAVEEVAASIRKLTPGPTPAKVETWRQMTSFLAVGGTKRNFGAVLLFLIFLISVIGIVNSILLSTLERVREIGLLKALGMSEGQIVRVFVLEGLGLGLLGGLAGVALAALLNLFLVNVGFDISFMTGKTGMDIGYPVADRFYGAWNWAVSVQAFLLSLLAALLASYFPAKRAARLDAVEALRRA